MCENCDKLKHIITDYICKKSESERLEPYSMTTNGIKITWNQLLESIQQDSEFWKDLESSLYLLTFDLFRRGKIKV